MRKRGDENARVNSHRFVVLSVCLVLTFALIVGFAYYLFTGIVEYQAAQFALTTNAMLVKNVQSVQSAAKSLFDQMTLDGPLAKLLYYRNREPGELLTGLRQLNAYRRSNPLIDSIYLYNGLNDTYFISSDHSTQAEQTRRLMFDQGVNDLLSDLRAYDNLEPIVRDVTVAYPKMETITYVTFLRYNALAKGDPDNVMIINIRADALFQYLGATEAAEDAAILFMQDSNVLLSAFSLPEDTRFLDRAIAAGRERGTYIDAEGAVVCYDKSFSPYWWLISRTDIDQIKMAMQAGGNLTRVQLLLVLLLVMVLLSIRLLSKWLRLFRERTEALRQAESERKRLAQQQRRQLLLRLINTRTTPGDPAAAALLESAGAAPITCARQLVLLVPDGLESLLQSVGLSQADALLTAISALAEEAFASLSPGFALHTEKHRFVILVEYTPDIDALRRATALLREKAASRWPVAMAAVVSAPFDAADGIAEAYAWAQEAMAYLQLMGKDALITQEEIAAREAQPAVYPETTVRGLTAALMQLDAQETERRLSDVLAALSGGSYRAFQIGLSQLLATLDEVIATLYQNNGMPGAASFGGLWYAVSGQQSVADIHRALSAGIDEAFRNVEARHDARRDGLFQAVSDCIEARHSQPDFSQADIAEAFGLSIAHLSREYKKWCGVTLSDGIQAARMAHAVRLLTETALPVGQVAKEVGFLDPQYFYRVFKKAMGTTPNQYRQMKRGAALDQAPKEEEDERD